MLELVEKSDVLIENYIPGKLDELGIGYECVRQVNPNIIYASITGFGPSGPYAKRAGFDVIATSYGGLMSLTGPEDGDPCKTGVALTDLATGLYAKSAIMAGLFHRQRHGKGCKIDCNLLSTQVSLLTNLASSYLNCGETARRRGTAHESIVPYQSFKCKDCKWITIGAISDKMFRKLCHLIGLDDIANDDRFGDNARRVTNREELIRLIQRQIECHPIDHWLNLFDGSGFSYGPVNDIQDVFRDPQVIHNQSVVEVESDLGGDPIKTLAHAVGYRCEDNSFVKERFTRPPLLAEHTKEILKSVLNYDDSTITQLIDQNVIQSHS